MVKFCMKEWTKVKIRPDNLYWPQFGSQEGWICQTLIIYVNSKEPSNQEESDYAACWKGSIWAEAPENIFKVKEEERK